MRHGSFAAPNPGRKHSPNRFSQRASSDADVRRPAATSIRTSVNRRITASGHAVLPKPIVCSTCATRFSGGDPAARRLEHRPDGALRRGHEVVGNRGVGRRLSALV